MPWQDYPWVVYIGLYNIDTFSHLGIFSRRLMSVKEFNIFDPIFADAETFNQKLKLFWWGAEKAEEGFYEATKKNMEKLTAKGIQLVFVEFSGTSHEWQTLRDNLYDFASRLFRD